MSFGPIEALVLVVMIFIVVGGIRYFNSEKKPLTIPPPSVGSASDPIDPEDPERRSRQDRMRRARFEEAVQSAVVQGWAVESRSEYQAVLVRGQRVNHILHLILSILTLGFWVIIWLVLVVAGGQKRQVLTVDAHGAVTTQGR